ncbi:MAG: EamA family transporter [Prevotellaceae bacterium]|nr:EamA family transporter [Prevotellaceae bacterium]
MFKVIILTIIQCFFLAGGQVCFKLAIEKIGKFTFSWACFADILTNWWLLFSGILLLISTVLWAYIIKHFPFSVAYPLTSLAYVIGLLAATVIFHESVPLTRWLGVVIIVIGVYFVIK